MIIGVVIVIVAKSREEKAKMEFEKDVDEDEDDDNDDDNEVMKVKEAAPLMYVLLNSYSILRSMSVLTKPRYLVMIRVSQLKELMMMKPM